jgi:hypothetical protein
MCGLVGVASSEVLSEALKKAFNTMLYVDVLRGEDSTGVACVHKAFSGAPEVEVKKSLGAPTDFFYEHGKSARDLSFWTKAPNVLIGHNRFATQGAINKENAHPFEFDNVVGAHNGTVLKHSLRKFDGAKEFDVDSQIIYSHLSSHTIDDVWRDADGAMALTWFDKTNDKLNIIRNKERPLSICYTEDDKAVLWSSELWMLQVGAMKAGVKLKDPVEVAPNRLFTFGKTEDGKMHHTERDLPPFVDKTYYTTYGRNYANYSYWLDDDYDTKPPLKKPDVTPTTNTLILIKEFHDTHYPSAIGYTTKGEEVRVNIPFQTGKDAKNKIVGRGNTQGYYVAKRIFKNSQVGHGPSYWANWADLTYCKLKSPNKVVQLNNNGFKLEIINPPNKFEDDFAPWHEPHKRMTQPLYEENTKCGCFNCFNPPNWGHRNELYWLDKQTFFCAECQTTPLVQDIILQHLQSKKVA